MIDNLVSLGIHNVELLPNCRPKPKNEIEIRENQNGSLRCVFFSMIYPEKGVDLILEAARKLKTIEFDFWGSIRADYQVEFSALVNQYENCHYRGIFKTQEDDVYKLLSQYDVILFPTRLATEGIPGALVEAKISGIPAIVSDTAYNKYIVQHMTNGIVMSSNNTEDLLDSIKLLNNDRLLLMQLKINAKDSGNKYHFEAYRSLLLKYIK